MAGEEPLSRCARGGALAICLLVMAAAACSGPVPSVPATSTSAPTASAPKATPSDTSAPSSATAQPSQQPAPDLPGLRELAKGELKAWDEAYASVQGQGQFRPVGKLDGQIGNWESTAIASNDTQALLSGMVTAGVLPTARPLHGFWDYRWDGGTGATDVTLISAQRAFEEIRAEGLESGITCRSCQPIRFTSAKLVNVDIPATIDTVSGPTLGMGTTQAWAFTLDNSAVLITRIAVASLIYPIPPDRDVFHPLGDLSFQTATGRAEGLDLTIGFIVNKKDDSHPCTMNFATETVESKSAVVVILTPRPDPIADNSEACVALGSQRTATVHLAAPLGVRAVLESAQGQPVDVTLLP
jgi:hypothetical protein